MNAAFYITKNGGEIYQQFSTMLKKFNPFTDSKTTYAVKEHGIDGGKRYKKEKGI